VSDLSNDKSTNFIKLGSIIEKLKVITNNISPIDALELAKKAGNPKTENSVFIGALSSLAALPVSVDDMKKGLEKVVPDTALGQNLRAFELGRKAAYDGLCQFVACRE
jgi:Pyruvate/2-oxoacid:ferredoxin oxidoreductase gamma subunit